MDATDDFQSRSSRDGKHFELAVVDALKAVGFEILEVNTDRHGIEIDIVAVSPNDRTIWFECKGGYETRPGLRRSDTMKKACANGWYLRSMAPNHPPYVVVTTGLPSRGVARALLDRALADRLFDAVLLIDQIESWSLPPT